MPLDWVVSSFYGEPLLHKPSLDGPLKPTPQLTLLCEGELPDDNKEQVCHYLATRQQERGEEGAQVYIDDGAVVVRYTGTQRKRIFQVINFLYDRVHVTEHWYGGESSSFLREVASVFSASRE